MHAGENASSAAEAAEEERGWVEAAARGEQAALAKLYDRYAPLLMAVSVRILSDRRAAEDLVHDVFMEAWRQAKTYDGTRGSVRAWLVMRCRSRALDRVRAAGRAKVVLADDPAPRERADSAADPSHAPDRRRVRAALGALPEEQRQVITLAYFGGLSASEIAAQLDIPIGTVKSRVARGLGALRRGLVPEEGGQA